MYMRQIIYIELSNYMAPSFFVYFVFPMTTIIRMNSNAIMSLSAITDPLLSRK